MRNLATAIVIQGVALLFLCVPAHAQMDLSLTGLFRHYPLSGIVEADAGYGIPVWGTPRTPFSGYLRPRLLGGTAAIYNSADAALEVFPIAFFGGRAGGEMIQNDSEYSAYDCQVYRCVGRFHRTYAEVELSLGAGPVFAQARWRRERWSQPDPLAGSFIDPTSGLVMAGRGDWQTVIHGVLGYKLSEQWTAMAILRYAESGEPREVSRTPVAMLRYTAGPFSLGVGAGVFESALKKLDFTTQSFVRWEIEPSLALR
ncbi:MAG: hypothetical protein KF799_13675 [Bdellovibrionales bacterium]|nr:hypothetical protein [Bdellovibrionales bacterium]